MLRKGIYTIHAQVCQLQEWTTSLYLSVFGIIEIKHISKIKKRVCSCLTPQAYVVYVIMCMYSHHHYYIIHYILQHGLCVSSVYNNSCYYIDFCYTQNWLCQGAACTSRPVAFNEHPSTCGCLIGLRNQTQKTDQSTFGSGIMIISCLIDRAIYHL